MKIPLMNGYSSFLYEMNSLPIVCISVLIVIGFLKLDIGNSRFINTVSSATFGVYLLHDNVYVRPFIWKTLFKVAAYAESNVLIPYSLAVIAVVYLVCTLIELGRIYLIEKRTLVVIDRIAERIEYLWERLISHLLTRI